MKRATSNSNQGSQVVVVAELLVTLEDMHHQNELLQDNVHVLQQNQYQPQYEGEEFEDAIDPHPLTTEI